MISKKNGITAKYLTQYAEPEVADFLGCLQNHKALLAEPFSYSLVIPAYQETSDFVERLVKNQLAENSVLLILVINQPDKNTEEHSAQQNSCSQQVLFEQVKAYGQVTTINSTFTFVKLNNLAGNNSAILVVDRFTKAIPHKQGVGLARKMGCDLALALIEKNIITRQFIASSDADAILPQDYFVAQHKLNNKTSAACYNFYHHSPNQQIQQATALYEKALRYYVTGLKYANSPYAFFTIGSILLINSQAYAQVRGFPKRSAGEDFYLLNKLAKLGNIEFLEHTIIELQARISDRVPFGTGPAVAKILALQAEQLPYCYYHGQVFTELKNLLIHSQNLYAYLADLETWLNGLSVVSQQALIELDFIDFVNKQKNTQDEQFNKQFVVWFDAFKTLKFIHALRDHAYPDLPLVEAIARADFVFNQ